MLLSLQCICVTIHLPTHPPNHLSISFCSCPLSTPTLPLFPAEIISSSKNDEKAQDCEEDDGISCHHQTTGAPLNLLKKKARVTLNPVFLVKRFRRFPNIYFNAFTVNIPFLCGQAQWEARKMKPQCRLLKSRPALCMHYWIRYHRWGVWIWRSGWDLEHRKSGQKVASISWKTDREMLNCWPAFDYRCFSQIANLFHPLSVPLVSF